MKNNTETKGGQRSSNLELYRSITMLLIIAHHYVVNSGLTDVLYADPLSYKSISLFLFGAWGKIGINCFILITGYFMCKSNITLRKFVKLVAEVLFYRISIYFVFLIFGVHAFEITEFIQIFCPMGSIGDEFWSAFIMFFLCIPFLNILIRNLSEKQHVYLVLLGAYIYVFFGTIPILYVTMNYVSWFIVLYFISSYIRIYPKKIFTNTKFWGILSLGFIVISAISVIACLWAGELLDKTIAYRLVTDSNTFLALATGLSTFMFFKNKDIKPNKLINTLGASTFGVLIIHANSDMMRQWLWQDTLNTVGAYEYSWTLLHAIGSVIAIFIVCSFIDYWRIRLIEKPLINKYDDVFDKIVGWYQKLEMSIFNKLDISGRDSKK